MSEGNGNIFWRWFFLGNGNFCKSGIRSLLWRPMTILHILVALVAYCLSAHGKEINNDIIKDLFFPLIAITVGISFSLGGTAMTLLLDKQANEIIGEIPGIKQIEEIHGIKQIGISAFIFMYQRTILVIYTTILYAIFIQYINGINHDIDRIDRIFLGILFFLVSLSLHSTWGLITNLSMMLQATYKIKHGKK